MKIMKSFFIAVAIYSRIPVPQFEWKEEHMKYVFCFFPWIGAFIGVCIYFWNYLCAIFNIGILCRVMLDIAISLFITGGFHVDGFMDTMDAIHSYSPKEQKLEILKDSHIGAFAVIMLVLYGLVFVGALSEITDNTILKIACSGFFMSRCLCGISAVSFPLAKNSGMLYTFADGSQKNIVKFSLYLQSSACILFMLYCSVSVGLAVTAVSVLVFVYYFYKSRKEFGGITGDTSGYFVLICELCIVVVTAMGRGVL